MVGSRKSKVNFKDFFANEVRSYSIYACERAIPSGVDGLKPSQRKVLFGMQKKFGNQEVKVSIASAGCMEISAYHHGSLDSVIVNMAQDFPGSNNMPLLEGIGQFGSRISPTASATRYIFTKVSSACKMVFHPVDDNILEWNTDDDVQVEPKYYLPILPMVLINGASGMGTGFSTSISAYEPKVIKEQILAILKNDKKKQKKLVPWYRGFTGKVEKDSDQTVITGKLEVVNTSTLKITELPVGTYTSSYRETLNKLEDKEIIKSYEDNCSEEKTEFIIKVTREVAAKSEEELLKTFKLVTRDTENLVVWDENGKIRRFTTADALLQWFVAFRLTKYEARRQYMLQAATKKSFELTEEMKFIRLYLDRSTVWSKTKTAAIEQELLDAGFTSPKDLLAIRISRLTADSIVDLEGKIADKEAEIVRLNNTTATDLYIEDLNNLKV